MRDVCLPLDDALIDRMDDIARTRTRAGKRTTRSDLIRQALAECYPPPQPQSEEDRLSREALAILVRGSSDLVETTRAALSILREAYGDRPLAPDNPRRLAELAALSEEGAR